MVDIDPYLSSGLHSSESEEEIEELLRMGNSLTAKHLAPRKIPEKAVTQVNQLPTYSGMSGSSFDFSKFKSKKMAKNEKVLQKSDKKLVLKRSDREKLEKSFYAGICLHLAVELKVMAAVLSRFKKKHMKLKDRHN